MKPMFTVHVGEYLVGSYIEHNYSNWNVWLPSKDTGVDLLVSDKRNRKTVSLQVKFSKDFNPSHGSPVLQSRLLSAGWWNLDARKIAKSNADFWLFVLPSFVEKEISFIIIPPAELLRRFRKIHGAKNRIDSYLRITKTKKCWDARGLPNADQELIALDRFTDKKRDFTIYLDAWKQIEARLR